MGAAQLEAMLDEAARGGPNVKVRHMHYEWSNDVKGAKQFTRLKGVNGECRMNESTHDLTHNQVSTLTVCK